MNHICHRQIRQIKISQWSMAKILWQLVEWKLSNRYGEQLRTMSAQHWATDNLVEATNGTINYQESTLSYCKIWKLLDATDNNRAAIDVMYIGEKLLIFSAFPDVFIIYAFLFTMVSCLYLSFFAPILFTFIYIFIFLHTDYPQSLSSYWG